MPPPSLPSLHPSLSYLQHHPILFFGFLYHTHVTSHGDAARGGRTEGPQFRNGGERRSAHGDPTGGGASRSPSRPPHPGIALGREVEVLSSACPHSPPWRHSGGFRPSRKWGRTAGDVSLPAPSAGGRRRIPRRRGGRLSLLRKNAPSSAVWSASLLRSVCQKEEGRGRSEVCVCGGGETTTDAAFINMDDFGEGLGARPLLARRACQVPPSVPPTNWPFRLLLLLTGARLGFPSVLCPSLAAYNGRLAISIRLVCSRLERPAAPVPSRLVPCPSNVGAAF